MQLNRLQFKTRHPFRPIVRYDIFKNALPPPQARIIGTEDTFEQLPLPEVTQDPKTQTLKSSRTRKQKQVRELVYEPYEEPA